MPALSSRASDREAPHQPAVRRGSWPLRRVLPRRGLIAQSPRELVHYSLSPHYDAQRSKEDAGVQQKADIVCIPGVQVTALIKRHVVSAMQHGPAGDPGAHQQPVALVRLVPRDTRRQIRSSTDLTHIAPEDVEELRGLVETRSAQKATNGRDALIVDRVERRAIGIS